MAGEPLEVTGGDGVSEVVEKLEDRLERLEGQGLKKQQKIGKGGVEEEDKLAQAVEAQVEVAGETDRPALER